MALKRGIKIANEKILPCEKIFCPKGKRSRRADEYKGNVKGLLIKGLLIIKGLFRKKSVEDKNTTIYVARGTKGY